MINLLKNKNKELLQRLKELEIAVDEVISWEYESMIQDDTDGKSLSDDIKRLEKIRKKAKSNEEALQKEIKTMAVTMDSYEKMVRTL